MLPVALGSGAIAAVAAVDLSALPTLCPLQISTGHACPLCGMTRAIGSLVTGDVGSAVQYHPMSILLSLQLLAVAAIILSPEGLFTSQDPDRRLLRRRLIGVNAVAFFVVWAIRWRLGLLDAVIRS